jgi:hypothetical protein
MEEQKSTLTDKWRPMMGWTYMATCLFDFIVGPVVYNVLQFLNPGQHVDMWQAVTLQGGGLYHLSMGAILGISAYGRTQEKINGATTPPAGPSFSAPAAPIAPAPTPAFAAPVAPAPVYAAPAAPAPVYAAPVAPAPAAPVTTAFGPGPAPQVDEPL